MLPLHSPCFVLRSRVEKGEKMSLSGAAQELNNPFALQIPLERRKPGCLIRFFHEALKKKSKLRTTRVPKVYARLAAATTVI